MWYRCMIYRMISYSLCHLPYSLLGGLVLLSSPMDGINLPICQGVGSTATNRLWGRFFWKPCKIICGFWNQSRYGSLWSTLQEFVSEITSPQIWLVNPWILPECAGDETWHNEDVGTWILNPKEVLAPCDSESSWGVSKWSRWWRSSKSLGLCQQCSDWTVGKPFGEICGSTSRWKLVSFKVSFRGSARSRCRAAETSMCYWWICV